MKKPSPLRPLWRLSLAGLLLAGGLAAYHFAPWSEPAVASGPPVRSGGGSVPVVAAPVLAKAMPVQINAIGHVQTIASVAVRPRIDGELSKVLVKDGQEVKKGDLLFQLDDRQAQAQLQQAQGTLMKDRAQLQYAKAQVTRYAPLAKNDFVSRDQYQQTEANAAALEGTVRADEAQVANAETQLSYTEIRAPIDGRIGTIAVKEGNTVQAANATPLATINQIHPIYVAFSVPQRDLARIERAMNAGPVKITAVIPSDEDEPQSGQITYIENAIDQASSTLSVKGTFANPQNRLWPGQFVNVVVTLRVQPDAITVPSEAVLEGQNGQYVFVIKPDTTVESRPVTIDRAIGKETVIAKGLTAGEQVVTSGHMRLSPGTKVRIVPPTNQGPGPGDAAGEESGAGAPS